MLGPLRLQQRCSPQTTPNPVRSVYPFFYICGFSMTNPEASVTPLHGGQGFLHTFHHDPQSLTPSRRNGAIALPTREK